MQDPVSFSARCPICKSDVSQGPRELDEIVRLLSENCLYFYCDVCDYEWKPSYQTFAAVKPILS
jgi:hypothetical protein